MSGRGRAPRPGRPGRPAAKRAQGSAKRPAGLRAAGRPAEPTASVPLAPLRLTYVEGATPAKWIRAWSERMPQPLEHERVAVEQQTDALRAGDADAGIVRLPIDADGLHVVRLYDERAFVVAPADHAIAELDAVTIADLAGEPTVERDDMTWEQLVEVVASGAGVAVMPQSLARLHHRRDVAAVAVTDAPSTTVALVWRVERDADDVQALAAITRGRSARSSR